MLAKKLKLNINRASRRNFNSQRHKKEINIVVKQNKALADKPEYDRKRLWVVDV